MSIEDGECMHEGCWRKAVRIVAYEKPNHREFLGQTHDCCNVHSRATKKEADLERANGSGDC